MKTGDVVEVVRPVGDSKFVDYFLVLNVSGVSVELSPVNKVLDSGAWWCGEYVPGVIPTGPSVRGRLLKSGNVSFAGSPFGGRCVGSLWGGIPGVQIVADAF